MTDYRELLLGCGFKRAKHITAPSRMQSDWVNLDTIDSNAACDPDLVMDLNLPDWDLQDNFWDEVHAYEVLEHLGQQGDVIAFFSTFNNINRILRPGGYLCATTPSRFSPWLWGDPGHRRVILPQSLTFLSNAAMEAQPVLSAASDYAPHKRGDFRIIRTEDDRTFHRFILQKV